MGPRSHACPYLGHDANGAPEAVERDLANVLAVDEDAATLGVVETEEQAQQGRFAVQSARGDMWARAPFSQCCSRLNESQTATRCAPRAAGAHDGDALAGGDGEAHVLQDEAIAVVAKRHVLKADLAAAQLQGRRARPLLVRAKDAGAANTAVSAPPVDARRGAVGFVR